LTPGVIIQNQGWLIYGGNTATYSLKLTHLDQAWGNGPAPHGGSGEDGICIVKVHLTYQYVVSYNRGATVVQW
jgi:hypothetical protein